MIKNILFDQGGVIVDLDSRRCIDALLRLGMADPEQFIGLYAQAGPFAALEAGTMSVDEFHRVLLPEFPANVSASDLDEAFQSFIVGIPLHRLQAITELRRNYKTYILSNTNPIMMNGVLARNFAQEGKTVHDYFDGLILSYEAGCCKPERHIFDYAVERYGIRPEESLFLDDGQVNVDAARNLGFHAALVPPGTEFVEVLRHKLNLTL